MANPINIPSNEIKNIVDGYKNLSLGSELNAETFIKQKAKKLGVDKNELYSLIKKEGVSRINSQNKVLHFHRTSLNSAQNILNSGSLLNRENLKNTGYDISHFTGSSSKNVQFTVDKYDNQGNLTVNGFDTNKHNIGANASDVVFVMGPKLLNEDSYDCYPYYPTVEKASIKDYCVQMLAKDPETLKKVQEMLEQNGLDIPVVLQNEFDREALLNQINQIEQKQEKVENENPNPVKNEKPKMPESCEEAYNSIDINNLTGEQDLTKLIMAANFKKAPIEDQSNLKKHISTLVKSGVNIYSSQAQIMNAVRNNPASVYSSEGNIKLDSSGIAGPEQAKQAEDQLRDLARCDSYVEEVLKESPYEKIFSDLERAEELKAIQNKREMNDDYSQSDYYEDQISQLRNSAISQCSKFEPQKLLEVAGSKMDAVKENMLVDKGIKAPDGPVVLPSNNTTKAVLSFKGIANKQLKELSDDKNLG